MGGSGSPQISLRSLVFFLSLNTLTANIRLPVPVCHTSYSAFAALHYMLNPVSVRVGSTVGSENENEPSAIASAVHRAACGPGSPGLDENLLRHCPKFPALKSVKRASLCSFAAALVVVTNEKWA